MYKARLFVVFSPLFVHCIFVFCMGINCDGLSFDFRCQPVFDWTLKRWISSSYAPSWNISHSVIMFTFSRYIQSNIFYVLFDTLTLKWDTTAEPNSLETLQKKRNHIPLLSRQTERKFVIFLWAELASYLSCHYVSIWRNQCFMCDHQFPVSSWIF